VIRVAVSNNFFRFKQFTVHQDKCAMKVCTDACLFGSLLPISSKGGGVKNVLDIGTGTGLLSLMYAQKNIDAIIDAVEIDEAAAQQTKKNFQASPWKERLTVFNTSIQQFNRSTAQLINNSTGYDLIISNPPFFENHLKSNNARRNLALHNSKLSLEELLNAIDKNLKDEGIFAVLLAHHCLEQFINLAHQKLFYPAEKILIKQTPRNNYFRSILLFTRQEVPIKQLEIIIQDEDRKYTNEFVESLKDYYFDLTFPKGGL
jgi:tRNA1Val (adenine37-N6)-methyltransferase